VWSNGLVHVAPTFDVQAREEELAMTSMTDTDADMAGSHALTKTYVMPASVEATWRAFTDPRERQIWFGFPLDPLADAIEVNAPTYMRVAVNHPGLPGPTATTVAFEPDGSGARVTHTLGGYGDGPVWENALQTSAKGVDEMMSDLALYLHTGVGFPRHVKFGCFDFYKGTREVPGGLEIFEAQPGTLAAEVGLQPGDIVVALGGAGVFSFYDVNFASNTYAPGDIVEVTWVRGGELHTERGHMTGVMPRREDLS
jgi:hypothetical protein